MTPTSPPTPLSLAGMKVACSNCNLRELCMPVDLSDDDLQRLDQLIATRRKVKRKTALFRTGD